MRLRIAIFLFATCAVLNAQAAIKVIADNGATQSIDQYVSDINLPDTQSMMRDVKERGFILDKIAEKNAKLSNLMYPALSKFTPGVVTKHRLNDKQFPARPIFIIGCDKKSIKWAEENAAYLRKIRALGIITNIQTGEQKSDIEKKTGLALLNASIDGLEQNIGTDHYPVLIYQNWVVQ